MVTVEVWLPPTAFGTATIERTVGATLSIMIADARLPGRFWLPAASVNVSAATETVPGVVELGAGVKIAV